MDCITVTLTHIGLGFGLLFLGLVIGLAANLERIGRIARWKAELECSGLACARTDCGVNSEKIADLPRLRLHKALAKVYSIFCRRQLHAPSPSSTNHHKTRGDPPPASSALSPLPARPARKSVPRKSKASQSSGSSKNRKLTPRRKPS